MDTEAMKAFARERVEVLFNRGELDRIEEFVTADFVNHEAWPGEDPGYEGFRLRLGRLHSAIPDIHLEIHEVVAGDDLVAYRATLSGTHEGDLLGMPPTGRRFAVQHMHMLRMRDGLSSEHWATRDDLGMLQQLGIIPPAGGPLGRGQGPGR
jgi:predicted ester cyclase